MYRADLTVLILSFNESKHIERCIRRISSVAKKIILVDSYSNDGTVAQARKLGAQVVQHPFVNHAEQLNWALDSINIQTSWVMRLDADEFPSKKLIDELHDKLPNLPPEICGLNLKRQVQFLNRRILFGGFGSSYIMRIWRRGTARCESRWMDEHMILSRGKMANMRGEIIDDNLNDLFWWTRKHITYASREAIELLDLRYNFLQKSSNGQMQARHTAFKRTLKEKIYSRLPLGYRSIIYFLYRMFILGGVLDGPRGWVFHFLQGLWYRLMVDLKIWEVEKRMTDKGASAVEAIHAECGIDLLASGTSQ